MINFRLFNKISATARRPRKPANKRTVLTVLRWQILYLGIAFVLSILDQLDVMHLRANDLLVFLFMAFFITVAAYFDINDIGVEHSEPKPNSNDKQDPDHPIAEGDKFHVMRGDVLASKVATSDDVSGFLDACSIRQGSQEWNAAFAGLPIQVDDTTMRFIRI